MTYLLEPWILFTQIIYFHICCYVDLEFIENFTILIEINLPRDILLGRGMGLGWEVILQTWTSTYESVQDGSKYI